MESEKRFLIAIVACAFFMEGLDGTIINTALPQIAYTLHTDPLHIKVALTAYLLAAGIIIPVSGWLADRFGSRPIFTTALLLFLLGSIACGFSQTLPELVVSRVLQGIGGALSLPVGRLLFIRTFTKAELVSAMSLTGTFGLLGPSLGPLVGGALTTYFHWRAIFFVNIPIGLVGFYFALKHIENIKNPDVKKFDAIGFIILCLALSALLIGLDTIIDPMINNFLSACLIFGGILGIIFYFLYAKGHDHALISIKLFKDKNFHYVIMGSLFIRLCLSAPPFLGPLLLQVGFGYTAMASGIMTAAAALGMLITKTFIPKILKAFGYRQVLIVNSCILTLSTGLLSLIALHPPVEFIFLLFFLNGIITSIQFSSMNTLAYSSIAPALQSSGSSFISSMQQITSSFGIAVSALILELFLGSRIILHTHSPPAFQHTFLVLALCPLISSLIFRKISNNM